MRTSIGLLLTVLTALVLVTSPAFAQSPEEIAQQATEAFQAGDYEVAIGLFEEAFALDPHPVILFNLARAYQESGDYPAALLHFKTLRTLDAPPNVLAAAEAKIAEVEQILVEQGYDPATVTSATYIPRGELTITTQPEGAAVYVDGSYAGVTPYRRALVDEGTYALRIELDGFHPVTQDIDVHGGRANLRSFNLVPRTTLDEYVPPSPGYLTVRAPVSGLEVYVDGEFIGYTPVLADPLAPGTYVVSIDSVDFAPYSSTIDVLTGQETEVVARMTPLSTDVVDPHRGRRNAGTALMATSGAVIAGGAVLGVLALNSASDYRDNPEDPNRGDYRDTARSNALIADIAIGTGAALFVTGAILRWVASPQDESVDRDLLVRPSGGPGLGMGLSASW